MSTQFKKEELRQQFDELKKKSKKLIVILSALEGYLRYYYKQEITITCIYRSQSEQDNLKNKGFTNDKISLHTLWRAVDVQASKWSKEMIDDVGSVFNRIFDYDEKRPEKVTCYFHKGTNFHLHIQVMTTPHD